MYQGPTENKEHSPCWKELLEKVEAWKPSGLPCIEAQVWEGQIQANLAPGLKMAGTVGKQV